VGSISNTRALADLARQEVPECVVQANGGVPPGFGRNYVIPKPFDPRMIEYLCPAIAEVAVISGVARRPMPDMEAYKAELKARVAKVHERTRALVDSYSSPFFGGCFQSADGAIPLGITVLPRLGEGFPFLFF